jgi:hypothetical protein
LSSQAAINIQVTNARKAIAALETQFRTLDRSIANLRVIIEQNRPTSGGKIEVREKRARETVSANNQIINIKKVQDEIKRQLESHRKFISLDSELNRTLQTNTALTQVKELGNFSSQENRTLTQASRDILAAFEAAKKERVNANDAARLAEQLAKEQAKAAKTLEGILNPALAERARQQAILERQIKESNEQITRDQIAENRKIAEKQQADLRDLQDRFGNVPIDQFLAIQEAEQKAKDDLDILEAIDKDNKKKLDDQISSNDENKAIKDTFDNFIEGLFGIEQPSQTGSAGIDETKLAGAYRDSQDVTVDDIIEAHEIQQTAANEVKALIEVRNL